MIEKLCHAYRINKDKILTMAKKLTILKSKKCKFYYQYLFRKTFCEENFTDHDKGKTIPGLLHIKNLIQKQKLAHTHTHEHGVSINAVYIHKPRSLSDNEDVT